MNEVMYINKKFFKTEKKENLYVRIDFPEEELAKIWQNYDWEMAENKLFRMQCLLTKAAYRKNFQEIRRLENKIIKSSEARMLAVRKVSEELYSASGIDGVRWRSNSEKMRAAITLSENNYKAKPFKHYVFKDEKSNKERQVGVPSMYDRAMQILYSYPLEVLEEAWADKRSFAFRKGRSAYTAHATLCKALNDSESGDWILVADIKSYYDTVCHEWLLNNIPMNKRVLREFIRCGMCLEDGEIFPTEQGISLRFKYFNNFR